MDCGENDQCKCFACGLNDLLLEVYPEGLTDENGAEILIAVAEVVGCILSRCGRHHKEARDSFLRAVEDYRVSADAPDRAEMH
jgi:hypothetical protein